MTMPIGAVEFFLTRREAQYLDDILRIFAIQEIHATLATTKLTEPERVSNLYTFMQCNTTLANVFRNVQEKGGAVWMSIQWIEHVTNGIGMANPENMSREVKLEHHQLAQTLLERLQPRLTLVEGLVNRWEESPLTTKSKNWD